MELIASKDEILEIFKSFYHFAKLKCTLFDNDIKAIVEYPKSHCSFCSYINSYEKGKHQCEHSNFSGFRQAKLTRKACIYRCHLGLVEAIVPLVQSDSVVGFVMFGQITVSQNNDKIVSKANEFCKKNDIDNSNIEKLVDEIKFMSKEEVLAATKILESCASYFVLKQLIVIDEKSTLSQIVNYINDHILEEININDLAKRFNISRTKLYTIFQEGQHTGIAEYIKNERLNRAIEFAKDKSLSVSEICEKSGFNDVNYFIKVFKKKTGMTPKKYQTMYYKYANRTYQI